MFVIDANAEESERIGSTRINLFINNGTGADELPCTTFLPLNPITVFHDASLFVARCMYYVAGGESCQLLLHLVIVVTLTREADILVVHKTSEQVVTFRAFTRISDFTFVSERKHHATFLK